MITKRWTRGHDIGQLKAPDLLNCTLPRRNWKPFQSVQLLGHRLAHLYALDPFNCMHNGRRQLQMRTCRMRVFCPVRSINP